MAVSATTVWEVEAGGSDTQCAGGFDASLGGTDYTQRTTAIATGTVTSATTTVTATSAIFTSAMVGNYITDGSAQWKRITAYTSTTVVTVDSAPSWTAATIYVGGAFASVGMVGKAGAVTGNIAYVQSGTTYTIGSASTNVATGCISLAVQISFIGYASNRTLTNTDAPAVLSYGASGCTMFNTRGYVRNFTLDGNAQTSAAACAGDGIFDMCTIKNMNVASSATSGYIRCYATTCSAAAFPGYCFGCRASACTATPFLACPIVSNCIADNNTGATTDGFSNGTSIGSILDNNTAYNNGRNGFLITSNSRGLALINNHSEKNAAYGYDLNSNNNFALINCGDYNNTSGRSHTTGTTGIVDENPITLTGSAFTNAAGNDFSLNATAGAGAALRSVGFPGTFLSGSTTGYNDVGAVRHQDPAGGSGTTGYAFVG